MSSIPGLPLRGSDVDIAITRVHLHPLGDLVEFWGTFNQDRTADYQCLAIDLQSPGNTFQEFEGNPGDQCLVQIDGTWHRSRIVSKNDSKYNVFLFDKGITYSTTISHLAWGKKKHFHLPPEVEFCVLANVLPLSPESRWSPVALDFLKSLTGKSVRAHVQDVLVAHRTFLLHIPCISKQMYEMGIAKKLSPNGFQDFVLMSLQSHSGAEVSPETKISMGAGELLHKKELFMYPELPAGTVETVVVTEVTNPQRIFCQLKVFSLELKKLSGQITQCCEGRMTNCIVGPEMIGFPCAARGSDGRWHRSVLQQVYPTKNVVEVLNVDYGKKQFVQVENIRPLAAEFFRMPVVTYICSLHGIIDKGVGWTTNQIDHLRTLLLHKTVIAKFEYQSISEGVHYVTLYGDDNTNINTLFGSIEGFFLQSDYAMHSPAHSLQHPTQHETIKKNVFNPGKAVEGKERKGISELSAEVLPLNSLHVALVQHVSDPSEFWIQTQNYTSELDELMGKMYHLYKDSLNADAVINPTVGLFCAAKAEDGEFYRATVSEVGERKTKVCFVDYGNTEVVDRSNIRTLPDEFKKLPCLSLKCTLAGVKPKDEKWSQRACEFFIKAVTDKELTVHVTAKYDKGYVVQLTDPEAQGEKDLSTLMCRSGLAERVETPRQPKAKRTVKPVILPQLPDARLTENGNKCMSLQTLTTVDLASNERRIPIFKEHMFPIGSVLDVCVSYIESPNDFWCQLVQNAGHLTVLMHDMQAYYAGSDFQPLVGTACVSRHPDNKMWYRALVIHKHETPDVDVLFVDYGQTHTVSIYDLRRISPKFLSLYGQAFRCSLLNPVDPTSAINEWNEEAVARFHSFVETAALNLVILKCTIYAVMYSKQKIVFNIVDLETPFESICTNLVQLVKNAPPKKTAGPSFNLNTYYYSTHNVKTGTEEQVTVTCVNNVSQFYCQLERNADVIKDLKIKVSNLCHQLENVKLPTVFGTLCFAKYTDGQWYRGQIKATKPVILVHFVDYGDTIEVQKSDLLPVPREATDIMSVPVQAVVCSLSDVPANVPSEMNSWFERSSTECKFRALIVAREPDGKLLVELYQGNTQVNSKIKKMFQIEMHTEEKVVYRGALGTSANAQKTPKVVPKPLAETENHTLTIKKNVSTPKLAHQMRDTDINLQSASQPSRNVCKNGQKIRAAPLELYRPPHQKQSCARTPSNSGNGSEPAGAYIKPRKEPLPTETKQLIKADSADTESQKQSNAEKYPKLLDLPAKVITSGMEADVYVSHCNSPLSFYVQLVREEDEIFSLVEKLNDPQSTPQTNSVKEVHPGDLVQAEFADDSSWYRAVVREIHGKTMALAEFVDFGNTAMMPISKIGQLHKTFLQLPLYSTHCMLSEAAGLTKEEVLDPEVVSLFKDDIGDGGEKVLKCRFMRQLGSVWEVSLEDSGVAVMCKVPTRCSTDGSELAPEKLERVEETPAQSSDIRNVPKNPEKVLHNLCPLFYQEQEFLEGQKLEVYISNINDAQTFWCQRADSDELDKITSNVSKVGEAGDQERIDPGSLSPGNPCIALFSDDCLWYRAEVIDKDGDKMSVLFVDYGNESQVSVKDVRAMPPSLMQTPPQAFLCELEGFDTSNGSWDSGAVDMFSALTTEKALQLTVTRVTREEGKIKYLVLMEHEGQVINEALKTWWKSSTAENEPDAVGLTTSNETPLQCDSTVEETLPPEDQLEYPEGQEMHTGAACTYPQRDFPDERSTGELGDSHTESFLCDSGINETLLPSSDDKGDQILSRVETDKDTDEEFSVMDIIGTDDLNSPMDEDPTDESLLGEVNTCSTEISSNIMEFSVPTEQRDEVTAARAHSLTSTTTVKMICREAFAVGQVVDLPETHDNSSEDLKQNETELVLPAFALYDDSDTAAHEPHTCTASSQDLGKVWNPQKVTCADEEVTCANEEVTCADEEVTCADEEVTCADEEVTCADEEVTCADEEVTCADEEVTCADEEVTCDEEEVTCADEEVTCADEEVTCADETVTCADETVTCADEEVTCADEEVTCDEEEVTCADEEVTCADEEVTCDDEEVTCAGQTLTCDDEEVTCADEEVTCADEEVTCDEEEVTCADEEVTCADEEVTCADEEVTCDEEEVTCADEEVTCADEEVTCADEEVTCADEEVTCADEEVTCADEEVTCDEEEVTCADEEVTCADEEVTCADEEVTCADEEVTCADEEVTCADEEVTCADEEVTCADEEVTCADEEVTCAGQTLTCADEEVTCDEEEVTCADEEVTCDEEEVTCADEEVTCADPNEPSDDGKVTSAGDDCLSSTTAEETVQKESQLPCWELFREQLIETPSEPDLDFFLQDKTMRDKNDAVTEDEAAALHQDELFALPSATEPQADTVPCPELNNLVEEMTCRVAEICLSDVCREAEGEASEQQVRASPDQREEFSDEALTEQMSSSADDSFEAQLSKITHLSLIINDGPDEDDEDEEDEDEEQLLVEQQPEE